MSGNLENLSMIAHSILRNEIKHLPLVPSVALKLLELTQDDNVSLRDLSRIIETEPTLAVKILRNVNAAVYALPKKITSINRAVNLLGFSAVRQLALDLLFYDKLIIKNRSSKVFDVTFFWRHCLFVALLSKKVASALHYPNPDLVYTAGLIHDIGKVILESYGRLTYSDFIPTTHNSENSILEDERRFFGLTHAEMGYVFCSEWQLPEPIVAVVACHHNHPAESSRFAAYKTEIAIVSFANYVAWMQGISSIVYDGNPVLQQHVLQTIDIDKLDLDSLLQQVDQDMQNTRKFYGIQFPSVTKLRATLVKTTINLSQIGSKKTSASVPKPSNRMSASLTIPHRSLNPDEFVPRTLEAIQSEFSFDRCILFDIDSKRRCLISTHIWPEALFSELNPHFEIDINAISKQFIQCLREKKAAIIDNADSADKALCEQLATAEFLVIPVLNHSRLIGLLYADNSASQQRLHADCLAEILPIANELGIALFHAKQFDLQKRSAELDPLTQLYNKRMLQHFLNETFKQDATTLSKLAIGFTDIDKFKLFNDLCGHQAGDDVLKIVADIMRSMTRPGDFISRYGGEEFVFILRDTDQVGAKGYAERLRLEIERRGKLMSQRFHGHELTISIGVAMYNPDYANYLKLIEAADQAMYRAKKSGRNRVVIQP